MRKPKRYFQIFFFFSLAISLLDSLSFPRVITACLCCCELSFCCHDDCWVPQSVLLTMSIVVFKNLLIGNLLDPNGSLKVTFLNTASLISFFFNIFWNVVLFTTGALLKIWLKTANHGCLNKNLYASASFLDAISTLCRGQEKKDPRKWFELPCMLNTNNSVLSFTVSGASFPLLCAAQ